MLWSPREALSGLGQACRGALDASQAQGGQGLGRAVEGAPSAPCAHTNSRTRHRPCALMARGVVLCKRRRRIRLHRSHPPPPLRVPQYAAQVPQTKHFAGHKAGWAAGVALRGRGKGAFPSSASGAGPPLRVRRIAMSTRPSPPPSCGCHYAFRQSGTGRASLLSMAVSSCSLRRERGRARRAHRLTA